MDNTKYIALSRQMALWKQMDFVSNNMANMNTAGYKQDEAVFSSYLVRTTNGKEMAKDLVYFTQDYASFKDFSAGMIAQTGNTFDVALQGDGFFAVQTEAGERYTRKGQFSLNVDGQIVTNDGYTVLSENNEPFFIAPGEKEVVISENGDVSTENGIIGRLKVATFADNQKLSKVAGTMFANTEGNNLQIGTDNVKVIQKSIEKSNVNGVAEMTKMVQLQRSYDMVQQMINEEHDRLSNTINAFAKMI